MDADRFDGLTRSLTQASSRRGTLGVLVGGALGLLGLADGAAKKKNGKGNGKGRKKKNKGCPRPGDSHLYYDECFGVCTNVLVNHNFCGGCDAPGCDFGQQCVEGTCVGGDAANSSCDEFGVPGSGCAFTVCCAEPTGSSCHDIHSDTNHCGTCNHACAAGKTPACCWGRCRDLHADPLNCGKCFNRCPKKKPICYGGQCRETCPPGLTKCGKTCLHRPVETCCNGTVVAIEDLQHDATNCGGCGKDCAKLATSTRPPKCCSGVCCDVNAPACCSGQCTNITLNDEHCGACGNPCGPNERCRFGACYCPPGADC